MVRAKQNRHCLRVCQDVHFLYSVDIIHSTIRCNTELLRKVRESPGQGSSRGAGGVILCSTELHFLARWNYSAARENRARHARGWGAFKDSCVKIEQTRIHFVVSLVWAADVTVTCQLRGAAGGWAAVVRWL